MALAHRLVLIAVIFVGALGSAFAQVEVDEATIAQAFSERIPRGWAISEFIIEGQENYGTSIEPDLRSRFQAQVVLNEDSYIAVSQSETATLLQRMASAGETRTFYGVSTSRRQGAGWETTFAVENDPTAGLGRPSGFFAGRIVVLGTDAESAYRAELQALEQVAHEATLSQMSRDEAVRARARESELAEAAHAIALEEADREARREAEVAAQQQEALVAAAERERASGELAIRQQSVAALVEAFQGELEAGLATRVPAFWSVEAFTLGAHEVAGTAEAPTITQVVDGTVGLDADLYASVAQEFGVTLLDVVEDAGATRVLYASVTGVWNGTYWVTDWSFESLDGLRSGLPLDQFPAHAIIIGSAEETAWRVSVEADRVRRAARLAALVTELESGSQVEREAAIARALVSGYDAEANLAIRHALADMSLVAVRLSLYEADAGDEAMEGNLRSATPALGLEITEFDPVSGEFAGRAVSPLPFVTRDFVGRVSGTNVSILWGRDGTISVDLDSSGNLDGPFVHRGGRALRATIELP